MDVIRCDEPSYLIWKWHPAGSLPGEGKRENSIRWGSSLRVREGEAAVFVYSRDNGEMEDFIEGPYDQIIETENFPVLSDLLGAAYDGGSPFQAEVYFINLARIIQVRFGVPYFDVYDPRYEDFGVPVAVRGTLTFKISDYKQFIRLHRLAAFELSDFQNQIKDALSRYIKDAVANAPAENDIPLVQIETKTSLINDTVEIYIKDRLREDFGVEVTAVDIGAIELDKSSEGYQALLAVTRDLTKTKVQAETTDYAERLRIRREEEAYALHKGTQSANLSAFQTEKLGEVGVSLGNSPSTADEGNSMASLMAGMALGKAVGENLADSIRSINSPSTPPPIPEVSFYLALEGEAAGPFKKTELREKISSGTLTRDTLVWTEGMKEWQPAGETKALQDLFPPPIPKS